MINDRGTIIDRPRGQAHTLYPDMIYPSDYGHVPGTTADGEEFDVFVGSEPTPTASWRCPTAPIHGPICTWPEDQIATSRL